MRIKFSAHKVFGLKPEPRVSYDKSDPEMNKSIIIVCESPFGSSFVKFLDEYFRFLQQFSTLLAYDTLVEIKSEQGCLTLKILNVTRSYG